jgi:hypothetical protein
MARQTAPASGVPMTGRRGTRRFAVSVLIDGEAVAWGDDELPILDHLRYRRADVTVLLDLLELDGRDL